MGFRSVQNLLHIKSGKNHVIADSVYHFADIFPKPSSEWPESLTGHVTEKMLESTVNLKILDKDEFVLVCGSDGFVDCVKAILQKINYPDSRVHVF